MAVQNRLANSSGKKLPFTVAIQTDGYKRLIQNTLADPRRAARFVTAITSAVSANPALQDCDAGTILSAGLLGEGLNLSPSPQLGQYYLVPFNDSKNHRKTAQFQLGYKGYIQLAIRSGQYKKLNVLPIKEGELVRFDPLNEEIEVQLIQDARQREGAATAGYYAMFEYTNGFREALYWSKEKMESHARKYSKGYAAGKGYTFWEKDFDAMACKTMLRQLISKWGIMSIEMERAITNDMTVQHEDGTAEFIESVESPVSEPVPTAPTETNQEPQETEVQEADFSDVLGE